MESNLNYHLPVNQLFGNNTLAEKSEVIYFLEDLYTYPPKIKVQWNQLDLAWKSNKIVQNPSYKSLSGISNRLHNIRSFNFYNKKINPISQALKNIPVYIIVNGRNELVLSNVTHQKAHSNVDFLDLNDFVTTNLNGNYNDLKSLANKVSPGVTEKALSIKSKKFGFIFFDLAEAELYLDTIIQNSEQTGHTKRAKGVDKIGLSIHCIGLDSAYKLLRHSSNVDFRLVPNLTEITRLLQSSIPLNPNKMSLDIKDQLKQTLSKSQCTKHFQGVPIYLLQVRNRTQHNADLNSKSNYIFFDKDQAVKFAEKFNADILCRDQNSSQIQNLDEFLTISTYSLEDFLESWEESLLLDGNNSEFLIGNNQSTYFISSNTSDKILEQHYNKLKPSLVKSIKLWGRSKLNKLFFIQSNYLGLVLRGYKL